MPTSRRLFLLASALASPPALACWGQAFHFSRDLPGEHLSNAEAKFTLEGFLDSKYGPNTWEFAENGFSTKGPPDTAEQPEMIPIQIGSTDTSLVGLYRKVSVFSQRFIDVLDSKQFSRDYLPPTYNAIEPEKNNPKAWRMSETTKRKSVIGLVAEYDFGLDTYPEISMRYKALGAKEIRTFAAFIPRDASKKIAVAIQPKAIKVHEPCSSTIFVEGRWPKDLKSDYDYQLR